MSDYFENNPDFEWGRDEDDNPIITVDHGDHSHTLDFSNSHATVEDFESNPNQVFGDAHRESGHDYYDDESSDSDDND